MSTKPQANRPPTWLSRTEKLHFKRVAAHLSGGEAPLNVGQTDMIGDLVAARSRISTLRTMLDAEVAAGSTFISDKARILALSGQINSTTALAHRIAERLGL